MTLTNWKRNAVLFIIGQFLSMFGSMLVQFAITWQITLETQSGLTMTLFTCAALLPMVFISPFAGVWADRYNRKHLIIIADAAIAIMTLFLAVAYMSGYRNIWLMLLVVAARSFGQGIQQPAVSAMIPQIVPKDSLLRFNAIQSSIQSLNMFASPMAAGALLTLMPIERIFFLDVITAVAGIAVILLFVKVSGMPRREPVQKGLRAYMDELRAGWRYIGSKPWLKLMILYSAFFSFFASPAALLSPLQTVRTFGDDVWRLTAIEITFSLGSAAGGLLMSLWPGFKNKAYTIAFSCTAFGLTSILLGIIPVFWLYLGVMLACGLTMPIFHTPSMTIMQTNIEPDKMGRVFSVMMMFSGLAMPLGMVIFGPLGDIMKIEWLLIVTGAIIFVSGLALLKSKSLIEVGKP